MGYGDGDELFSTTAVKQKGILPFIIGGTAKIVPFRAERTQHRWRARY
jgi:hypothetical protein